MPVNWTTNKQIVAPAAANAQSITPSGTAYGSSAYVTILGSMAADSILTAAVSVTPGAALQFEIDVAVGPIASEVNIATFKGIYGSVSHYNSLGGVMRSPIGIDAIPSGSRVSFRIRVSTTSVAPWTFAFSFLEKPITGNLLTSAKALKVVPNAATLVTLPSSTGWANPVWTEIVATTTTAQVIAAFQCFAAFDFELEFGIGSAGVEAAITTWRGRMTSNAGGNGGPNWFVFDNPLNAVPIGSRVVMRARSAAAGGPLVGYAYHQGPL